jgi:hypothetical protein
MLREFPEYPAISDVSLDPPSIKRSVQALKEAIELLTGQRGDASLWSPMQRVLELAEELDTLYARFSPQAVAFPAVTGAPTASVITSATVNIVGSESGVWPVTVRGNGTPEFQVNGGSWVTTSTVVTGDTLTMRLTSSGSGATERTADLYLPGRVARFSVTTA